MFRSQMPVLASALVLLAASAAHAGIVISEVNPNGSSSAYAADWFEVTNTGPISVDVSNWKMDDSSNAIATAVALTFVGPSSNSMIAPGKSVIFAEDTVSNAAGGATVDAALQTAFVNAWFGGAAPAGFVMNFYGGAGVGLSSGGDAVNLFDGSGNSVTGVTFGSTTSFAGATLDNAAGLSGAISTKSVAGVNSAFSDGIETGSPGSVPEPAALSLFTLGTLSLLLRRRHSQGEPKGKTN